MGLKGEHGVEKHIRIIAEQNGVRLMLFDVVIEGALEVAQVQKSQIFGGGGQKSGEGQAEGVLNDQQIAAFGQVVSMMVSG